MTLANRSVVRQTHLNVGLWPACIGGNILLNESVIGQFSVRA